MDRKGKAKNYEEEPKGEDLISKLPDPLLCDILYHVSTEESVRTSVLSKRWRSLWLCVLGLDLVYRRFSNHHTFMRFLERFFDSHKESMIRKFRLCLRNPNGAKSFLIKSIDAVTMFKIQRLDVYHYQRIEMPLSIYTCETLIELRLSSVALPNAEFVSLPCLKCMSLEYIRYSNDTAFEKLILGSPVLEDLTIMTIASARASGVLSVNRDEKGLQVRSQTLKRISIDKNTKVVVDAPLLQYLKTRVHTTKNFKIIGSGFSGKLDIGADYGNNVTLDILTDIPEIRYLVISGDMWNDIFHYTKLRSGRFWYLTLLNAKVSTSYLDMLPTVLECCPILESLILDLVKEVRSSYFKIGPNVVFSTVPHCLVSSLEFVELKSSVSRNERATELVRYFLKNSTILKKLKIDMYYTENAKRAFREELDAMPRCSSSCEVFLF